MSDKKSPNPYKGVPNPKLPQTEDAEPKAIFLSTITGAEFESKLMTLNSCLYTYHVNDTNMCTSNKDSGPGLNASDSEDIDNCKPPAMKSEDTVKTKDAVKTEDFKLVAIKKEDVEVTRSDDTVEVGTQTCDDASPGVVTVKKEDITMNTTSTVGPNVDSPHSYSSSSTARSSRTCTSVASCSSARDNDGSDSEAEASVKKHSKKGRSVKKNPHPIHFRELYGCTMLVAPPKKPMTPQDVIYDECCDYCRRVGDQCLNMRFGRFCIAYCYRYYHNNPTTFTQAGIVDSFKEAYKGAYNCDLFLKNQSLTMKTPPIEEIVLPGCLEARSLIFVVNMVLWEYMIAEAEKTAGYCSKKKSKSRKK